MSEQSSLIIFKGRNEKLSNKKTAFHYFKSTEKKVWRAGQYHIMLIADCRRSNLWANVPKRNAVFRFFNHIFCFYSQISYVKINNLSFVYYSLNIPVLPKLFSHCAFVQISMLSRP